MAEAAPAPLRIAVGSKNPVKLAAVRRPSSGRFQTAHFRVRRPRRAVRGERPAVGPR